MQCFVYRSSKKEGLYVYFCEKDRLDLLPEPLMAQMGEPEFALSFKLHEERTMGSEDPLEVMANLATHGYHVQIPKDVQSLLQTLAHRQP